MLPSSHSGPMDGAPSRRTLANGHLADAFTSFIAAADKLEHSHSRLHDEVVHLRTLLEDRNRALASSLAENERMRLTVHQILDGLPCGVAVVDTNRQQIVLLNPEAHRLLEIPTDRPPVWGDIPARIRTMLDAGSGQAWKEGDEQDFSFQQSDKMRWVTVRYSMMTEGNSAAGESDTAACTRVILTCRDTTISKEAEHERETSRNAVALAEMATVLAHEIRNPLGSLELFAGLLATDAGLNEDSKQCIQHLQAGVRSLSAVVNNVLRFHSSGTSNLLPTRLAEALRSAVNFVQPLARQSKITLTSRLSLGEIEIAADAGELQQVILNLVCNALRHTPVGGVITLSGAVEPRGGQQVAIVEVGDTGRGIRPEDLPHIFEPGFSTSRQSPGLGLTVCQRIVEQHGSAITVRSEIGKGTVFHMEFAVL